MGIGSVIYQVSEAWRVGGQRRAVRRAIRAGRAEPIFVFGLSRSGSTWLQETIGAWGGTASLFEPIHRKNRGTERGFTLEDYREGGMSEGERSVVEKVLRGEVLSRRVLEGSKAIGEVKRLCVKLIHCNNGMGRLVAGVGPRFRPVVILRHPCAHVASWKRLKWTGHFSGLSERFAGVLGRRPEWRGVVEGLKTPVEMMAGSWCLGNYVPLFEGAGGRWTVVRYEEMEGDPATVLGEIFGSWGEGEVPGEVMGVVRKVVRTTWREGQPAGAVASAESWKGEVGAEERRAVFEVCGRFGVEVGEGGYGVG